MKKQILTLSALAALLTLVACGDSSSNPSSGDNSSSPEGGSSASVSSTVDLSSPNGGSSGSLSSPAGGSSGTNVSSGSLSSPATSSSPNGGSSAKASSGSLSSTTNLSSGAVSSPATSSSSVNLSSPAGGSSSSAGDITSFTDTRDGKVYPVVRIGTQVWFAKNLNVGTKTDWNGLNTMKWVSVDDNKIEKMCFDNLETNCDTYGGLYEWYEAMQYPAVCAVAANWSDISICKHGALATGKKGICPDGWHIPDTTDFNKLYAYVASQGYVDRENVALRATSFFSGLDAFGFGVIGGGIWSGSGWFDKDLEGVVWSSSMEEGVSPFYENWDSYDDFIVIHEVAGWREANSIRCLQD